ncbi:Integral membrane protein OS=Streptomyces alboniger OX=132473 GN=CP975_14130 PE=4 SV=1 [Streptomyces alboniger]
MEARDAELKKELDATLHARRELGEEYNSALVDSFLGKVEQRLDGTIDRRLRRHMAEQQMVVARGARSPGPAVDSWGDRFGFGVISLILAVPLSAIGVANAGMPGLLTTWAGIVAVNVAQAARGGIFHHRRKERDPEWED